MRTMLCLSIATVSIFMVTSCSEGATDPTGGAEPTSPPGSSGTLASETSTTLESVPGDVEGADMTFHLPDAVAMNLISDRDRLVVAWKSDESVLVQDVDLDGRGIGAGAVVSGETAPFAHYLERPTLAVLDDGLVLIAYTALDGAGGSVYLAGWDGDTTTGPDLISGEPLPETNLVEMILDEAGDPILAWLENSTLSVGIGTGGQLPVEQELVDDLTCDCCNPSPVSTGDGLVVAYRNLEREDGDVVRDVVSIRSDDGATFEEPVLIADAPWLIDACPFSGPSMIETAGGLLVAWMDARQSVHPDQQSSTIWMDRSSDGGATWGTDLSVATDGFHRWPVVALDQASVLHLVWETQGPDGGLSYSFSTDRGTSFAEPMSLVANNSDSGNRNTPSVAVHGDQLAVSWIDREGGHIAIFSIDALVG